jgi:hypothetical protein
LAFALGSFLDVGGKVQKVVKREGQCKLVIESNTVPGFVIFADCTSDAETVRNSKIRKGSLASVRGRLRSFGGRAVCLSDCRLQELEKSESVKLVPRARGRNGVAFVAFSPQKAGNASDADNGTETRRKAEKKQRRAAHFLPDYQPPN